MYAIRSYYAEEEQFRQKNIRLAEKGFLPTHEAIGIYQPIAGKNLPPRPALSREPQALDPDIPRPPMFFTQFLKGANLFTKTLERINAHGGIPGLDSELAALINKVISADRIRIRNRESIEKPLEKTMSTLSLGLEVLMGGAKASVETAADLIKKYFLEDIFRTGSREGARLQAMARKCRITSYNVCYTKLLRNFTAAGLGTLVAIVAWCYGFDFLEHRFAMLQYVFAAICIVIIIPYLKPLKKFINSLHHESDG